MIYLKSCVVDKMGATSKEWLLSEVEELIGVWESCVCLWDFTLKDYKYGKKMYTASLILS